MERADNRSFPYRCRVITIQKINPAGSDPLLDSRKGADAGERERETQRRRRRLDFPKNSSLQRFVLEFFWILTEFSSKGIQLEGGGAIRNQGEGRRIGGKMNGEREREDQRGRKRVRIIFRLRTRGLGTEQIEQIHSESIPSLAPISKQSTLSPIQIHSSHSQFSQQAQNNEKMEQNRENGEVVIPTEVMDVLPKDSNEQLELAMKITCMAFESLVPRLETETVQLREKISERNGAIGELKERLLQLDQAFRETDGRLRLALEENIKVCKERDALAQTTQKLSRDVQKLETFKRQLIHTLSDDNPPQESIDITTCDQSNDKVSTNGETRAEVQKRLITSTIGFPNGISISTVGSPKMASSRASSPVGNKPQQIRMAMTPWHRQSADQSYAATSPPHSRSITRRAQLDGKEFFRQARTRLSYEQFGAFLANIKELNAQKQSREETLKKAREIFGLENKDLYLSFHNLVNRNMS
ncbi:hypothetical protein LUZ60_005082 [Juncus effusus]|nr:hypothetical protein LUZ60_005082 [Juncus effusus]